MICIRCLTDFGGGYCRQGARIYIHVCIQIGPIGLDDRGASLAYFYRSKALLGAYAVCVMHGEGWVKVW